MANQEDLNRSHGQRIRRVRENVDGLISNQEHMAEVVSQHDRDIKVMKARIANVERQNRSVR